MKIALVALLALLAVFVVSQKGASRSLRWAMLFILLSGAYLVWAPEQATAAAHFVGVGRGADLLLYLWVVITLSVILLLYLKIADTNRMMTELARQLALSRPMLPPPQTKTRPSKTRAPAQV